MATKKFSPAQLAAQKLFAERARAGTLKKGKRKTTRKTNPGLYENINAKKKRIAAGSGERMRKPGSKGAPTQAAFEQSAMTAKRNPAKKYRFNVISKTSPRYVAGVFSSEALAKEFMASLNAPFNFKIVRKEIEAVKRNPDKAKPKAYVRRASQATGAPPSKRLVTRRKKALTAPAGYFPNPKVKYTNRAKDMKGDQRVGYAVHMADRPSYQAIAWFTKKSDAVQVAQEASDRTGKQLAVTRVQNYFGSV